jgi:hypothetical protein
VCGSANNSDFTSSPSSNLCDAGTTSGVAFVGDGWRWVCEGPNGGGNAYCQASLPPPPPPVIGICGSAAGSATNVAPTSDYCASGTASAVFSGIGWTWTCEGAFGGATANCSAPLLTSPNGTLNFTTPSATYTEGALTNVTLTVTRTNGTTGAISVPWSTSNVTAIAGTDYGTLNSTTQKTGTLTWAASDTAPKTITIGLPTALIPILNNTTIDGSRTFAITLGTPTGGALLGSATTATITIADNDAVTLNLTPASVTVAEGATATLTVTRSGNTTNALTVPWTIVPGTATSADYTGSGGTLNFAANAVSAPISIPTINDTLIEGPESFQVQLGTPSIAGAVITNGTSTVTITDNDSLVALGSPTLSIAENAGPLLIPVTRSGSTATAASLTWSATNGTARAGTDYGTAGLTTLSGTLPLPANASSVNLSIPILNNTTVTGDRNFTVTLGTVTGATLDTGHKTTSVTITDDEKGIKFASTALTLSESAGNATLTVTRFGNSSGEAKVNYSTANGTATAGQDYTASSGTLTWANGELGDKTLSVPITNDTLVEASETFTVTLSGATLNGAATGITLSSPTATVTITDNDSNLQFSLPTVNVSEKLATVGLTVTRTGSTTAPASVTWTTTNGSATAGSDYGIKDDPTLPTSILNFPIGSTSQSITIPILADTIYEGNETFTVTLSNPTGATLGITPQSTVTLQDDETGVQFEQAAYTVIEGTAAGSVLLKVTRIGPAATVAQTVKWSATNGTAEAGKDYGTLNALTPPSGTLTWPIGDITAKTITIPILVDTTAEGDETFTVALTPPTTGGIAFGTQTQATISIWDNDSPAESLVQFSQAKTTVSETAGSVTLNVTRTGETHRPASVKWTAANGSALAGSDYGTKGSTVVPSGTLNWDAGDNATKPIAIPILDDALAETIETFKITLNTPSVSLGLGEPKTASVVIEDKDEQFPLMGKLPAIWTVPEVTPGTPGIPWHVAEDSAAAEGKYVLKTDTAYDNEKAQIQVSGTFLAGNVSFKLKVSSEEGFDALRFYIDGVLKGEWSGNQATNWITTPMYPLTAANHTLLWSYEKDGSLSFGLDAAWVDSVVMPTVQ